METTDTQDLLVGLSNTLLSLLPNTYTIEIPRVAMISSQVSIDMDLIRITYMSCKGGRFAAGITLRLTDNAKTLILSHPLGPIKKWTLADPHFDPIDVANEIQENYEPCKVVK